MVERAILGRARRWGVPTLLGLLAATACSNDFDTTRNAPARGTLGAELYGVVCDRVGAQSLHEDLSGASYRAICHGENGDGVFGTNASQVDQTALPPIAGNLPNVDGGVVSESQQEADRSYGVARLERLAVDRPRLIAALDATFPAIDVPIKNLGAADPAQSCQPDPAGQGSLHTELANLLGRFTALYDDGTIPGSTEALSAVTQALLQSASGQDSWTHFNARAGYRPFDLAIGAARPAIAYKNLRAFVNATLELLSPDSNPYDPAPKKDAKGNRIPTPGAAYAEMSRLSAALRADLANETADPAPSPLVLAKAADTTTGANVLNRPRTDLETLQSILFAEDPVFGSAPFATGTASLNTPNYIVERDPRGYAVVAPAKGSLPAPFVLGADGLPEVDSLGLFKTSAGTAPTPFALNPADMQSRDSFGRAVNSANVAVYQYVDTSQSYFSALFGHIRGAAFGTSLLDSNPADNHETLMDSLAGAYVLFGPRSDAGRAYADGSKVAYSGYAPVGSPLGDLISALGQMMGDPSIDSTLSLTSTLLTNSTADVARVIGDALYAKAQADKHPEATIPAASTFWDEVIDLVVQIAQDKSLAGAGQTRLLEDILTAFAAPASTGLSKGLASQSGNLDVISYDRTNLNGPAVNKTAKDPTSPPATPPNHTKPDANANRSELQRFAQLVHDTNGVTLCNKEGAVLHATDLPIFGTADACASTAGNAGELCPAGGTCTNCNNARPFHECEMLKVSNLAGFYLDSLVGKASLYFRNKFAREGPLGTGPAGTGATSVAVTEASSQIGLHPAPTTAMPSPTPDDTYNGPTNMDPAAPGFLGSRGHGLEPERDASDVPASQAGVDQPPGRVRPGERQRDLGAQPDDEPVSLRAPGARHRHLGLPGATHPGPVRDRHEVLRQHGGQRRRRRRDGPRPPELRRRRLALPARSRHALHLGRERLSDRAAAPRRCVRRPRPGRPLHPAHGSAAQALADRGRSRRVARRVQAVDGRERQDDVVLEGRHRHLRAAAVGDLRLGPADGAQQHRQHRAGHQRAHVLGDRSGQAHVHCRGSGSSMDSASWRRRRAAWSIPRWPPRTR